MNLRVVRKKIKSVKNVKKITRAMQMVSAVKMKKAVSEETEGRSYRDGLSSILASVAGKIDAQYSPLLTQPKQQTGKNLVVFISANKGLCGSFHVNLIRHLMQSIDMKTTDFITLGSKGSQMVSRIDRDIVADYSSGHPTNQVSAIFTQIIELYLSGRYDSISLVFTKYISPTRSSIATEQILPLSLATVETQSQDAERQYIVEPSPELIIDALLRSVVEEKIRGAVVSSLAVEHSMRMMAMKNATDNAENVVYNLTLVGNKLRQEKITNELLDMITAKESVES